MGRDDLLNKSAPGLQGPVSHMPKFLTVASVSNPAYCKVFFGMTEVVERGCSWPLLSWMSKTGRGLMAVRFTINIILPPFVDTPELIVNDSY